MSRPTMRQNFTGKPGYGANGWPADNPPIICKDCGKIMDEETDDGLCEPCNARAIRAEAERTENRREDYFETAKEVTRAHAEVLGARR